MDSLRNPQSVDSLSDLSALSWVHEELRRSLELALKSLRRHLKESETTVDADVDVVDPAVLNSARQHLHQGVGALELVALQAGASLLRACEASVQRFIAKPRSIDAQGVAAIEAACFALMDYVARLLAGKSVSSLAMFPQYRAVQELAGADRIHPADLWFHDWQWLPLPHDDRALACQPDAATRSAIEGRMLSLMRVPTPGAAQRMSHIFAGLGAGTDNPHAATLWKLAAAMFEAQATGLLSPDVFSKRVASRLLAQLRILERGGSEISEPLARDLLFFCAQADSPGDGRRAPRLAAVRQAYDLVHHLAGDYHSSALGRFDPALIAQASKRVAAAKESWSGVAGGELHRINGLTEQFALAGESLKRLFPSGDLLAEELRAAASLTKQTAAAPSAALAMEAATSLLYVEACLEDAEFDHPELAARIQRLSQRMGSVRQGAVPQPLEGWMEELYRRMSDRQTMGSVVQELRTTLSEAEKLIDQFFRNPADPTVLIPVPNHLSAMRGVLSVLGMDHAASALLRMRDEVDGLSSTEVDLSRVGQAGVFDRLASNLGALGFLIDMLSVQPALAKSLFIYDPEAGTLSPVMGRSDRAPVTPGEPSPVAAEPRLIEQAQMLAFNAAREDVSIDAVARDLERLSQEATAADQPALAATVNKARIALEAAGDAEAISAARDQLSEALADFVHSSSEPTSLDLSGAAAREVGADDAADDDEMREVFLEEAREVIDTARGACAGLATAPDDLQRLTILRRAFHTLKGSARMVGLTEFGAAAWVCEQLYNTRLSEQRKADEPLLAYTSEALGKFAHWIDDIAASRPVTHSAAQMAQAAQRLGTVVSTPSPAPGMDDTAALPMLPESQPLATAEAANIDSLPTDLDIASALNPLADDTLAFHADAMVDLDLNVPATEAPLQWGGAIGLDDESAATGPPGERPQPDAANGFLMLDIDSGEANAMFEPFDPQATMPLPHGSMDRALSDDLPSDPLAAAELGASPSPDFELLSLELDPLPLEGDLAPEIDAGSQTDFVLKFGDEATVVVAQPLPEPARVPEPEAEGDVPSTLSIAADEDETKVIGSLRIGIPLFNIYLNEADELSRRLCTELAEWSMELVLPVGDSAVALAHSLAGSSATVGFADLSNLARTLEHALARSAAIGAGTTEEGALFTDAAEELRHLLHQFAAGFLRQPSEALLARLADHELSSAKRLETATAELDAESLLDSDDAPRDPAIDLHFHAGDTSAPHALDAVEAPCVDEPLAEASPSSVHADAEADESGPTTEFTTETGLHRLDPLGFAALKPLSESPVAELELDRLRVLPSELSQRFDDEEDIDVSDAIDAELFPIFEEEAEELLGQLATCLQGWVRHPEDPQAPAGAMRTLHTLKGGARLAGAMRLGELVHRLESRIENLIALVADAAAPVHQIEPLLGRCDALRQAFETVQKAVAAGDGLPSEADDSGITSAPVHAEAVPAAYAPPETAATESEPIDMPPTMAPDGHTTADVSSVPVRRPAEAVADDIDWSRFDGIDAPELPRAAAASNATSAVRVRAPLLDRLVNQAGEVSITRSRIASDVDQIKESLSDLTENLERLRSQLRDIELQAETQISSRMEAAKVAAVAFDPLEFDRFTRFQELTRMMAESVNDVATVQRTLQQTLQGTEDDLAAQARLTRELQDDLLRTRMVEFEGLSDRLYRVVRQAAKETGKQVRLDIVGGSIEIDRGVLDRMTSAFEHLVRNSVTHGIELPTARTAAGKDAIGAIVISVTQDGNEVGVEVRDDGAGLDLDRIRRKALANGLIAADAALSDDQLANLIFTPGFSTAEKVTELSGRGVGMDVVRSEVQAIGGRIETSTSLGQGTSFKLVLPLTTAVTQVVMVRCGELTVGVPSTLVAAVRRFPAAEVQEAYQSGACLVDGEALPFYWLGALLQTSACSAAPPQRSSQLLVVRSASQRVVIHVDDVVGNQEVVVKNLGPQLSRMPGLAGMTLLASGSVSLIYNPVALATLYGAAARIATLAALQSPGSGGVEAAEAHSSTAPLAPLVLVVDDSLTVRRVTERMLLREGYRVMLAKDGLDALERLAQEKPSIVLSDIEMPRMDGFDLVRNLRADPRLHDLPVIMITSRIAQKHRDYAAELGVEHYLGKPYSEEDLLALIAHCIAARVTA
jgi:chemosensory pili system protein ChpA (sensor histidine kinase/response regulator)